MRQDASVSQQPAIAGSGYYETYVSIRQHSQDTQVSTQQPAIAGSGRQLGERDHSAAMSHQPPNAPPRAWGPHTDAGVA